jgi:hypothetical protein
MRSGGTYWRCYLTSDRLTTRFQMLPVQGLGFRGETMMEPLAANFHRV